MKTWINKIPLNTSMRISPCPDSVTVRRDTQSHALRPSPSCISSSLFPLWQKKGREGVGEESGRTVVKKEKREKEQDGVKQFRTF